MTSSSQHPPAPRPWFQKIDWNDTAGAVELMKNREAVRAGP